MLRRNELLSHEKTRRNIKRMLLSERSQRVKATHSTVPAYDTVEGKTMETEKDQGLPGTGEECTDGAQRIGRVAKRFCRIIQPWIRDTKSLSKDIKCTWVYGNSLYLALNFSVSLKLL